MAKCKKCNKDMVLMSGNVYLDSDQEPYQSGEEIELNLSIDRYIHAHYCENCNKVQEFWEDDE